MGYTTAVVKSSLDRPPDILWVYYPPLVNLGLDLERVPMITVVNSECNVMACAQTVSDALRTADANSDILWVDYPPLLNLGLDLERVPMIRRNLLMP